MQAAQTAEVLPQRQQGGENLARVQQVGQAVDDRHAGMPRHVRHVGVLEGAHDDNVVIPRQHLADVGRRLPRAEADFLRAQGGDGAAELGHADLE